MPHLTATLVLYVKLPSGTWRYCPAAFTINGRVRLGYALVEGEARHCPQARYYLEYRDNGKRRYEKLPRTADSAEMLLLKRKQETRLQAIADALITLKEASPEIKGAVYPPAPKVVGDTGIADPAWPLAVKRINDFLDETERYRKKKTYDAYHSALDPLGHFLHERIQKKYFEQVSREDLLAFFDFLGCDKGNGQRTLANKYETVKRLYLHYEIPWPMNDKKDKPRFTKKRVTVYKERELNALFEAASREEDEVFRFFLVTGGREQDVMYSTWSDVDWDDGLYLVQEEDTGTGDDGRKETWNPKDREEAGIPIPDDILALLRERRARNPDARWIFPTPAGEPDGHFLRRLKLLALRAGLNCGNCWATLDQKPVQCDQHAVCHKWTLHKFRRTFATMHHLKGVPVRTISHWLRHSDLETTLRYLAAVEYTDEETRSKVNATFAGVRKRSLSATESAA